MISLYNMMYSIVYIRVYNKDSSIVYSTVYSRVHSTVYDKSFIENGFNEKRKILLRSYASRASHLGVCVEYRLRYSVHLSVQCSVQDSIQYIVQYSVGISVTYNIQEAGRRVIFSKIVVSTSQFQGLIQFIV